MLTEVNKYSSSQGCIRGRYSLPREGPGNGFEVLSHILSMITVIRVGSGVNSRCSDSRLNNATQE